MDSKLLVDTSVPPEYDLSFLGYGVTNNDTSDEEDYASVIDRPQPPFPQPFCMPDKNGNISQLSFRNRRASIEYRRASMALRRASNSNGGSRRPSVCGGGTTGVSSRRDSVCSLSTEGSDLPTGVYFGEVEILEFPLILGDNPAAKGCPTTLDWKPVNVRVEDVVYHEYSRGPHRTRQELKISKDDRHYHLISMGYTMNNILDAEEECLKIKQQRYATLKTDKQNKVIDDAFKKVFTKAYNSLEASVHDHPRFQNFLRFVPTSVGEMGRRVSSAVTTRTHRLSFSAKKHPTPLILEPQPPLAVAAPVAAATE